MQQATSLANKVVIITGGGGGIGRATAATMIGRGAQVAIADVSEDSANDAVAALGAAAFPVKVDLAEEDSIAAMIAAVVERFGRIDILVNNAAALTPELSSVDLAIGTIPTWAWDRTFTVNCRGTMIVTREALPHLIKSKGAIVNVVSNTALQGHVIQAAYSASKAAVIQMTRSVAAAYGRDGVRANAVAPGMTMTEALKVAFPPPLRKLVEDETLRDRLGEPDDIAEVIAFLASDAARNITGQVIVADGGTASHVPGFTGFRAFFAGAGEGH